MKKEIGRRAKPAFKLTPDRIVRAASAFFEGETHNLSADDFKSLHEIVCRTGSQASPDRVHSAVTAITSSVYQVAENLAGVLPAGDQIRIVELIRRSIIKIEGALDLRKWDEQQLRRASEQPIVIEHLSTHAWFLASTTGKGLNEDSKAERLAHRRKRFVALGIGAPFRGNPIEEPNWRAEAAMNQVLGLPITLRALLLVCEQFLDSPPKKKPRKDTQPVAEKLIASAADQWLALTGKRPGFNRNFAEFVDIIARGTGLEMTEESLRGRISRHARKFHKPMPRPESAHSAHQKEAG